MVTQMEEYTPKANPEADTPQARQERVRKLLGMVKADIKHWNYAFERMKYWRRFARGYQWPHTSREELAEEDRRYVANVTMRHLKQRTASIYAKNPVFMYRRSPQMTRRIWDGTPEALASAIERAGSDQDADGSALAIVQDAMRSRAEGEVSEKVGETLTNLYTYFVREQMPPTKKMMKRQVMMALSCGVGYVKQTFQRSTERDPDVARQIADHMGLLQNIERLSREAQEGDIHADSAEMEELREKITALESEPELVIREGLALDYPDSTNIVPDQNLEYLPGFVGCSYVTERYCLTAEAVREIYGKDVSKDAVRYRDDDLMAPTRLGPGSNSTEKSDRETVRVYDIWHRADDMVYTICDGYPDFLQEPHRPTTYTERFYPWFVYAPNALDENEDPFPPSDVELIMSQQMEINRAGEGLRQHRYAARPSWVTGQNIQEADASVLQGREAHSITVLRGLGEGERISDKLQPFPAPPIDPNLYNTGPSFQDILRSVGAQEANLGGVSGGTATESSIAESSRQSALESAIDELDDLLTEMARAGGQILLAEMSQEKVMEIVGPGAIWPTLTREQIAKELTLEAVAGSSGNPNQAQQVAMIERIYPLLFQLQGVSVGRMVKHAIRVLDDRANFEDWIDMNSLPVTAILGQLQAQMNSGGGGPRSPEGAEGGSNAPRAPGREQGPPQPGQAGMGSPMPSPAQPGAAPSFPAPGGGMGSGPN